MPEETPTPAGEIGLEAKLAFLRGPEAYGEPTRTVEAKETHMSWVFLTDTHAYKLKKPVRYAFLDFGTIEARRLDCEREVELNRRLAPDVYLGVVPMILGADGHLRLGGPDEGPARTVDWLVKMRRLPPERSLPHAIASGEIWEEDVRRIALRLAAFYRAADPVPVEAQAYRRRFEAEVRASHRELVRPAFGLPSGLVAELAGAQLRFLAAQGGLLEARAGRVVEGHGDLRPEHVYLGEPPLILDCLEFNRDFRILDPADELAYLAMECDRLGAPLIDGWLFATYREQSGDDPPRPLIEFYKCARAYLRAKIAIWHLDEPAVREPAKWARQTMQYLELAQGYARRLG